MSFKVSDITGALAKSKGFYKPSHFYVNITAPVTGNDDFLPMVEVLCEATSLPGMHFDTTPIRPMGYGTTEMRPFDVTTQPISLVFFVDNTNKVYKFFHKWIGEINNFGIDIRKGSNGNKLNYYEFAYPKEYEGTVDIYSLSGDGKQINKFTLQQAFPLTIADLGLAWETNNEIAKLQVTMAYNIWYSETLPYGTEARAVGEKYKALNNQLPSSTPEAPAPKTPGQLGPNDSAGPVPVKDGAPLGAAGA
jgi:hypothetical protein